MTVLPLFLPPLSLSKFSEIVLPYLKRRVPENATMVESQYSDVGQKNRFGAQDSGMSVTVLNVWLSRQR